MQSLKSDLKFILVNTYGPNNLSGKQQVWDELSSLFLKFKEFRIVIGGHFNSIISLEEKRGGLQYLSRSSLDFKAWIVDQGLFNIPIKNKTCTWTNRRQNSDYIAEKLDRFFILGNSTVGDLNYQSNILPYIGSDHYPVCLELSKPSKPARNSFKCEKNVVSGPKIY